MDEKRIIDIAIGETAWNSSLKAIHLLTSAEEPQSLKKFWMINDQPSLFLIGSNQNFKSLENGYGYKSVINDIPEPISSMNTKKIDCFLEDDNSPYNFLKASKVPLSVKY